jgi:hypothetical protein
VAVVAIVAIAEEDNQGCVGSRASVLARRFLSCSIGTAAAFNSPSRNPVSHGLHRRDSSGVVGMEASCTYGFDGLGGNMHMQMPTCYCEMEQVVRPRNLCFPLVGPRP